MCMSKRQEDNNFYSLSSIFNKIHYTLDYFPSAAAAFAR